VKFLLKRLFRVTPFRLIRNSVVKELWTSQDRLRLVSEHVDRLVKFHGTAIQSSLSTNYVVFFQDVKSQLLQDIFVASMLDGKSHGYFIEAGASDGIDCSNTFLLEKRFSWDGIMVEPSRTSYQALIANRSGVAVNAALWSISNLELNFIETVSPGLSTISSFKDLDFLSADREVLTEYKVSTISLMDLLIKHESPKEIDYLSLDTEGSEFEILRDFNFDVFTFNLISVEHDWNIKNSESVSNLLRSKGYIQVLPEYTEYENWFVGQKLYYKLRKRGFESMFLLD
jgi:FkbM family methyltransferase